MVAALVAQALAVAVVAQPTVHELPPLFARTHRSWSVAQGLPQASVWAVLISRDGYLWAGTEEGLARFDGQRFTVFDPGSTPPLPEANVRALAETPDGTLWVGTRDGGLWRFDGATFASVAEPAGVRSRQVRSLFVDGSGALWVGTRDAGAFVGGARGFRSVDGLPGGTHVLSFADAGGGRTFIGTRDHGLFRAARTGDVVSAAPLGGTPAGMVFSLASAETPGQVWMALGNAGVCLYDGAGSRCWGAREGVGPTRVVAREGRSVWAGLDGGGLLRLSDDGPRASPAQLAAGVVRTIVAAPGGALWVGTDGGGLERLQETPIGAVPKGSLGGGDPLSVAEDADGSIWIGTVAGDLARVRGNAIDIRHLGAADESLRLVSIAARPGGGVWVAAEGGAFLVDEERVRRFSEADGLPTTSLLAAAVDQEGALWLGTASKGAVRYAAGIPSPGAAQRFLDGESIWAVAPERDGSVYLGTQSRGLAWVRDGRIAGFVDGASGLSGGSVRAFERDGEGRLWVGTTAGLDLLQGGRVRSFHVRDGLWSDLIGGIATDGGDLWICSGRGLFKVPVAPLLRGARALSTPWLSDDGVPGDACSYVSGPAALRARDGRLWFTSVGGMAVVEPARLASVGEGPLLLHIESVEADGKPVDPRRPVRLSPGGRRLAVTFSAPDLLAPQRVSCRARLVGLESGWQELGQRRRVEYTNLPPGRYRLVLEAERPGGGAVATAALTIEAEAAFTETAAFALLCAAALVAAAFGAHRLRLRRLRVQHAVLAERQRLTQEIHDHLAQTMAGLTLQLDAGREALAVSADEARPYLERASQLTRAGAEETRRIVRGLRAAPLGGEGLVPALRRAAADLSRGTAVELRVASAAQPVPLSPKLEHELFRSGLEAIANAVRHGAARRVDVNVSFGANDVRLAVQDDGRGFDLGATADGLGLAGMRERAAACRGKLEVTSRPGGGTTVKLSIPVPALRARSHA